MTPMIFQQLVNEDSGCLSYLIGCTEAGQAIVVDPGRDREAGPQAPPFVHRLAPVVDGDFRQDRADR